MKTYKCEAYGKNKVTFEVSLYDYEAKLIYKPLVIDENTPPELLKKYELAKSLMKQQRAYNKSKATHSDNMSEKDGKDDI